MSESPEQPGLSFKDVFVRTVAGVRERWPSDTDDHVPLVEIRMEPRRWTGLVGVPSRSGLALAANRHYGPRRVQARSDPRLVEAIAGAAAIDAVVRLRAHALEAGGAGNRFEQQFAAAVGIKPSQLNSLLAGGLRSGQTQATGLQDAVRRLRAELLRSGVDPDRVTARRAVRLLPELVVAHARGHRGTISTMAVDFLDECSTERVWDHTVDAGDALSEVPDVAQAFIRVGEDARAESLSEGKPPDPNKVLLAVAAEASGNVQAREQLSSLLVDDGAIWVAPSRPVVLSTAPGGAQDALVELQIDDEAVTSGVLWSPSEEILSPAETPVDTTDSFNVGFLRGVQEVDNVAPTALGPFIPVASVKREWGDTSFFAGPFVAESDDSPFRGDDKLGFGLGLNTDLVGAGRGDTGGHRTEEDFGRYEGRRGAVELRLDMMQANGRLEGLRRQIAEDLGLDFVAEADGREDHGFRYLFDAEPSSAPPIIAGRVEEFYGKLGNEFAACDARHGRYLSGPELAYDREAIAVTVARSFDEDPLPGSVSATIVARFNEANNASAWDAAGPDGGINFVDALALHMQAARDGRRALEPFTAEDQRRLTETLRQEAAGRLKESGMDVGLVDSMLERAEVKDDFVVVDGSDVEARDAAWRSEVLTTVPSPRSGAFAHASAGVDVQAQRLEAEIGTGDLEPAAGGPAAALGDIVQAAHSRREQRDASSGLQDLGPVQAIELLG